MGERAAATSEWGAERGRGCRAINEGESTRGSADVAGREVDGPQRKEAIAK